MSPFATRLVAALALVLTTVIAAAPAEAAPRTSSAPIVVNGGFEWTT